MQTKKIIWNIRFKENDITISRGQVSDMDEQLIWELFASQGHIKNANTRIEIDGCFEEGSNKVYSIRTIFKQLKLKHMKKVILFSILFLSANAICFSQSWKEVRKKMHADQAIADTMKFPSPFELSYIDSSCNTMSKRQIFTKIEQWFATNGGIKATLGDSTEGKIIFERLKSAMASDYYYTITIDVRDGKWRMKTTEYVIYESENYRSYYYPIAEKELEARKGELQSIRGYKYDLIKEGNELFLEIAKYVNKKDIF